MLDDLLKRLSDKETVIEEFSKLHALLFLSNLKDKITPSFEHSPNWQALVAWSSLFAQSKSEEHIERALIGASAPFIINQDASIELKSCAAVVLEQMANIRTKSLISNEHLADTDEKETSKLLQSFRRNLRHFIFDPANQSITPVTRFQDTLWDLLSDSKNIALSAPTSAGKSFILERWVSHSVALGHGEVYIYIVPSRSLINQVSNDLKAAFSHLVKKPYIVTLPSFFPKEFSSDRSVVLIMTQERVERLLAFYSELAVSALVVDEAQKLGDGYRGVVLQRIIDQLLTISPSTRIVLAAPHAENVDILIPQAKYKDAIALSESSPTVLQNLIWVTQVPRKPRLYDLALVSRSGPIDVGTVDLSKNYAGKLKKLAAIASILGQGDANIIYANGAGEAEKIGLLLAQTLESEVSVDQEVIELSKLISEKIHRAYPVAETLRSGIGVHYGDMPEIVRREQERLFSEGKLSYLISTSTLLEGVNLPCKNLFVWGPRQGRSKKQNPMSEHAFWNLAGRAGRWGREFAGNIYCIDVHNESDWPNGPPRRRIRQSLTNSGTELLSSAEHFKRFISTDDHMSSCRENRYFEQIFGQFCSMQLQGRSLQEVGWARPDNLEMLNSLETLIASEIEGFKEIREIAIKHPSISPKLIKQLFEHLKSLPDALIDLYLPMNPASDDAYQALVQNLKCCRDYLGGDFKSDSQINLVCDITIQWVRGVPIGKIISKRLNWKSENGKLKSAPAEIRAIIETINKYARYLVPKYLACYSSCVAHWASTLGREDLQADIEEVQDLFESGAVERTMVALIGAGLSRTSAVEVSSCIADPNLGFKDILEWLEKHDLEKFGVSPIIIKEVSRVIAEAGYFN